MTLIGKYTIDMIKLASPESRKTSCNYCRLMSLDKMKCEPCRGGVPTLTDAEINQFYSQLQRWSVVEKNGIKRLERSFDFEDFVGALAFTNNVGELAEREGHHPDILTEWGRVTVSWWTHKIGGLHKNDFIMAAKTDGLIP